ncbi:UPF0058 family protein [Natrinema salaciae]|uniref:Uncharacterized protein family UPF0058 n=1 Tax=Natrinema salaciae TaxID=1186196 RepID=A0A1H9GT10_9EURY|nr:UPF0058 family protein [Natrinema salaciae]SEQ53246.1 Uncharacterised protein family UPF0058 [Natrinema salaciae]
MNEQELVHLHALLFELRLYLEREDIAPPDAFDDYDAQPVRPPHIHRPKEAHKRAMDLLLVEIRDRVRRSSRQTAPY